MIMPWSDEYSCYNKLPNFAILVCREWALELECARLRPRRPGLAAVPGALAARYASVKAARITGSYSRKPPWTHDMGAFHFGLRGAAAMTAQRGPVWPRSFSW